MPGQQYIDNEVDLSKRGQPTHLHVPEHALGRHRAPSLRRQLRPALAPAPDPSQGRRRNRKSVRWDPGVIDNEDKMPSRDQKTAPVRKLAGVGPDQLPGLKNRPGKTAKTIDPSVIRQPSNYQFMRSRRPISSPLPEQSHAPAHQRAYAAVAAAASNYAIHKAPSRNLAPPARKWLVPPAVPHAPRRQPPPAPRPARLPTPDLPDIEESRFFLPRDKITDNSPERSDPNGRPTYLKAEAQYEAATKYIKERKRRGW